MIDWHSHILPNMDDGSRDKEESAALLRMLAAQGIDTVIVTGTTTPNCIRATVFDSISLDYNTVVLEDCTSSVNEEVQRVNILGMKTIGAVIANAEDFLKETIDLPVTIETVRADIAKEK